MQTFTESAVKPGMLLKSGTVFSHRCYMVSQAALALHLNLCIFNLVKAQFMVTSLADLDLSKTYSYADYLLWQFQERVELVRGKIFKMSPAPYVGHQDVSGYLFNAFYNYLRGKDCRVYHPPFDVRLPKKGTANAQVYTVLQPDICVICDLAKLDKRGCLGAPDLVIEILSPSNRKLEMQEKYDLYEEAGVREYWLADYVEKTVLVYVLNRQGKFIGLQPRLAGQHLTPTLFTDLSIDLTEAFADIQ